MKLSDAFAQIDVTEAEASAVLTSLVSDISDSNPELYTKVHEAAAKIREGVTPPTTTTSSTKSSTGSTSTT